MSAPDPSLSRRRLTGLAQGRRLALATVIQTWGSAPQPVGQPAADRCGRQFHGLGVGRMRRGRGDRPSRRRDRERRAQDARIRRRGQDGMERRARLRRRHPHPCRQLAAETAAAAMLQSLADDIEARRPVALLTHLATGDAASRSFAWRRGAGLGAFPGRGVPPRQEPAAAGERRGRVHRRVQPDGYGSSSPAPPISPSRSPRWRARSTTTWSSSIRAMLSRPRNGSDPSSSCANGPTRRCPKIGVDARTALIALTHDPKIDDPCLIHALQSRRSMSGRSAAR